MTHFRFIFYKISFSNIYRGKTREQLRQKWDKLKYRKKNLHSLPKLEARFLNSTTKWNIISESIYGGNSDQFLFYYYYYYEGNSDHFLSLFVCRDPVDTLRSVYKYLRDMFSMGHGGQKYWGQTK